MAEYCIGFSENLVEAARFIYDQNGDSVDAQDADRTVLYLGLLSCEITMKALLESAGMSVSGIRKCSHSLDILHTHLCYCDVEVDIGNGKLIWISAAGIGCPKIQLKTGAETTVGKLLNGESQGASKYPNEIRYGEVIYHYPPEAILLAAEATLKWAKIHSPKIRLSTRITPKKNLHF